ncbi:MAG: hypothetical protein ABL999_20720 [Pyrinomonadaceae bacterium]
MIELNYVQCLRNFFWVTSLVLLIAVVNVVIADAQKPGDKVEYKAQNWPEKWEVGTFVKILPGGKQVLIREKPTEFFPEGSERAYALDEIRPVAKAPVQDRIKDPNTPPNPPDKPRDDGNAADGNKAAGPQMSQQDVLDFLRNRLGDGDPFRNPKREQVLQQLREEILRRGVNFRYSSIGDFSNQLGKFGALSNVTYPLQVNFGPPAKSDALLGKWSFSKVGAPANPMFGNNGSLVINANGSYVWNSASGVIKGKWRKATADEMASADKGGEGVVLLAAKSGSDWIAFKRNEEGSQGQGIMLQILPSHNLRERGTR